MQKEVVSQVTTADASVSTKVVAIAIPMADSSLLETPMNGHSPRNCTRYEIVDQNRADQQDGILCQHESVTRGLHLYRGTANS